MTRMLLPLIFISSFGVAAEPTPTPHLTYWTEWARHFTGESDKIRDNAVQKLKKYPNLKVELKKALGSSEHFLALDVISVLKLHSMLPDLVTFSERDYTGYSYHVINSLIETKDEKTIHNLYLDRLDSMKTSSAAKMAILDALARMEVPLGEKRVRQLLRDESPEVRSATLSLIRTELVLRNVQRNLPALETAVVDPAFQVRIQVLYLVSELPNSLRLANLSRMNALFDQCTKDRVPQVKSLCEAVRKGALE